MRVPAIAMLTLTAVVGFTSPVVAGDLSCAQWMSHRTSTRCR